MDTPVITMEPGSGNWTLVQPYRVSVRTYTMVIPAGFRFDLASVPRLLWWMVAPFQLSIAAPLVHDWLYRRKGCISGGPGACGQVLNRREADGLFLELMKAHSVHPALAYLVWLTVRLFGWVVWSRNRLHDPFGEPSGDYVGRLPSSSGQGAIPDRR